MFRVLAPFMAPVVKKQNEAAAVRLEHALSDGS
jgi:hypothetical protein